MRAATAARAADGAAETALEISSHAGPYQASFAPGGRVPDPAAVPGTHHYLADSRVLDLHAKALANVMTSPSLLRIEATETAKSLERFSAYVEHLVGRGIRRDHVLVAIGGGIVQDITCFLAATLLRGVAWRFYPTTLLAQADSCIGSKSSINAGGAKNILGTFTPPREVVIATDFLSTLDGRDVRSGIGEMLKVHAIAGADAFDRIAHAYDGLAENGAQMRRFIHASLRIKQVYIEADEFDRGPRAIFNYGHTFGHAIEAATGFAIPHGIAVTIGCDMANFIAAEMGIGRREHFQRMHPTFARNYAGFERHPVPLPAFLKAIAKDKKNTGGGSVTLILPDHEARIHRGTYANDAAFAGLCRRYLEDVRPS